MWEPLRGALTQIEEEGLADTLSKEEFTTSGGCYAPRRISRFDAGGSISRHATYIFEIIKSDLTTVISMLLIRFCKNEELLYTLCTSLNPFFSIL